MYCPLGRYLRCFWRSSFAYLLVPFFRLVISLLMMVPINLGFVKYAVGPLTNRHTLCAYNPVAVAETHTDKNDGLLFRPRTSFVKPPGNWLIQIVENVNFFQNVNGRRRRVFCFRTICTDLIFTNRPLYLDAFGRLELRSFLQYHHHIPIA